MPRKYFDHYLDGMFARYPKTPEVTAARTKLQALMRDRYVSLTDHGVSPNAAVGQVISEFGNLSDVAHLIDFDTTVTTPTKKLISATDAHNFLSAATASRRANGIGVALIMSCAVPMILLGSINGKLHNSADILPSADTVTTPLNITGIIILIAMLAGGIFMLFMAYRRMKRFRGITKGQMYTTPEAKEEVYKWRETHSDRPGLITAIGVALCVISPIPLIAVSGINNPKAWLSGIGVAIMLTLLAIAVNLFISDTGVKDAERYILQEGPYAPDQREQQKRVVSLNIAYWLVVVAIFFGILNKIGVEFTPIYWLMAVAIFYLGRTYLNRRYFPDDYSF